MSKVSTIYDNMITRVASVLSSHVRLPNPYKPDENSTIYLKKGYGVALGGAEISRRVIGGQVIMTRESTITVTRQYFSKENDPSSKASTEKQVLEDIFLVIKDFENDVTLNEVATNVTFRSDSGIEYVSNDKDQFLMVRATFAVDYFETLNS